MGGSTPQIPLFEAKQGIGALKMRDLIEHVQRDNAPINEVSWGKVAGGAALIGALATASPGAALAAQPKQAQHQVQQSPHKMLYDVVWAEASHSEEDVKATASVYINLTAMYGKKKAYSKSCAHKGTSPEYIKAKDGKLNEYEKKIYAKQKYWIDELLRNPSKVLPYDHHENIKAFGAPKWEYEMAAQKDIGAQRYYTSDRLYQKIHGNYLTKPAA